MQYFEGKDYEHKVEDLMDSLNTKLETMQTNEVASTATIEAIDEKLEEKLKEIEEKEQQIKAMEKERDDLNEKIKSLEASIADLQKKVATGAIGGADFGPKEYCVDVVNHNGQSEVDADGINSILQKRAADGWKLTSVINDDGGKIQSSLSGNDTSSGSLAVGAYISKVDRVVLIFERPRKK